MTFHTTQSKTENPKAWRELLPSTPSTFTLVTAHHLFSFKRTFIFLSYSVVSSALNTTAPCVSVAGSSPFPGHYINIIIERNLPSLENTILFYLMSLFVFHFFSFMLRIDHILTNVTEIVDIAPYFSLFFFFCFVLFLARMNEFHNSFIGLSRHLYFLTFQLTPENPSGKELKWKYFSLKFT